MKAKTLRFRMMVLFTTVVGVLLAGSYLAFWVLLAHEIPTQLNRQLLETARPLIADLYSRLDPHPAFKDLDVLHDVYRKRGTMTTVARDLAMGVSGDPNLIFSSSQANIAALSYFLALGWARQVSASTGVPAGDLPTAFAISSCSLS